MKAKVSRPAGRPSIPPERRLSSAVRTHLTREEHARCVREARRAGVSLSEWFRRRLTGGGK